MPPFRATDADRDRIVRVIDDAESEHGCAIRIPNHLRLDSADPVMPKTLPDDWFNVLVVRELDHVRFESPRVTAGNPL